MNKKYKLFDSATNKPIQSAGFKMQMPVMPMINPFTSQIQVANPLPLPTVNPSVVIPTRTIVPPFGVLPPPLAVGPKINIMPQKRGTVLINSPSGLQVSISGKEIDLARLLTMANKYTKSLSPFSDGLPDRLSATGSKWSVGKTVTGQDAFIYNDGLTPKYYTGAGILLLERNGMSPNVVLFNSRGLYQDCGGTIIPSDFDGEMSLQKTAKREVREETANLINVNIDLNNYVDASVNNTLYRGHVIALNDRVDINQYINNLNILRANRAPAEWFETNDMQKFNLQTLLNYVQVTPHNNHASIADINGVYRNVHGRTISIIRELYNQNKIVAATSNFRNANYVTNNAGNYLDRTVSMLIN